MADDGKSALPFTAWSFAVEIRVPKSTAPLCNAAFAECDGIEMTMDVKTIREGGNNGAQVRLAGPFNMGTLSLKRGMTTSFDLWDWMTATLADPSLRARVTVVVLGTAAGPKGERNERCRFELHRCLPVKLKAPALNAKDGAIAVEELQIAYESLEIKHPGKT